MGTRLRDKRSFVFIYYALLTENLKLLVLRLTNIHNVYFAHICGDVHTLYMYLYMYVSIVVVARNVD